MNTPDSSQKPPLSPIAHLPEDADTIRDQLKILDGIMGDSRQDIFLRVLNAKIEPISNRNIKDVGERYHKYWLSPDDLRLLKQPGMEDEVEERLKHGKFIEHFTRPSRASSISIAEQMVSDLEFKMPGMGEYFGYALRSTDTHEVLGFITGRKPLKPAEKINAGYRDRMMNILRHGVTGGEMRYTDEVQMPRKIFENDIPYTLEIDTVCGEPFSVSRLLADTLPEIMSEQQRIRVNLYRLYGLQLTPPIASMERVGENDKSDEFFRSLGARQFAIDQNPEGPSVVHQVDGEFLTVTPYWTWMTASGKQFRKKVFKKWKEHQERMGHFY